MENWRPLLPPAVVAGLGFGILAFAVAHHSAELQALEDARGPLAAFVVDTVPALAIVFGGWLLARADFTAATRWRIAGWTVGGGVLFLAVSVGTIVVREAEGRTVPEPVFPMLVSAGIGALAGYVAGYFEARARQDATRAERTSHAYSFVNDVLRHDVRNNLSVVRGNAELAATKTDTPSVADRVATIREQTDDALDRIDDAGVIASTISGDASLDAIDVVPIVECAAERTADAYGVAVTVDVPAAAQVRANEALRSVVENLVENAAEHNDADDPRVHVAVERAAETVRLDVRDNGPGVRPTVIEDVEEGGLDLAATLVQHYDGTITVSENDPRGAEFSVVLPRADAD